MVIIRLKSFPPGWTNKNFKHNPQLTKRYVVYKEVPDHRYYDNHYRRSVPSRTAVYKPVKKDPIVVFEVILKDLR